MPPVLGKDTISSAASARLRLVLISRTIETKALFAARFSLFARSVDEAESR